MKAQNDTPSQCKHARDHSIMTATTSLLRCLDDFGPHLQLCPKHPVPKSVADPEPVLVVGKVVLEVIFLQLAPVGWQAAVMQEIVRHVVAHVAEDAAAVGREGGIPIEEEYEVGELPEGGREHNEESRRHH